MPSAGVQSRRIQLRACLKARSEAPGTRKQGLFMDNSSTPSTDLTLQTSCPPLSTSAASADSDVLRLDLWRRSCDRPSHQSAQSAAPSELSLAHASAAAALRRPWSPPAAPPPTTLGPHQRHQCPPPPGWLKPIKGVPVYHNGRFPLMSVDPRMGFRHQLPPWSTASSASSTTNMCSFSSSAFLLSVGDTAFLLSVGDTAEHEGAEDAVDQRPPRPFRPRRRAPRRPREGLREVFLIMVRPKGDEKILSFGDVVLRRSDLDILRGPHYINDRIIEFFFCDLSTSTSLDDILLVPPSISFWIANCPDDDRLGDAVRPLRLQEKSTVLLTVNDNDDVTVAEGGHHWSLLAYERRENVFVHHDSLRGINSPQAEKLYKRLKGFLGDMGSSAGYVEGFTPRQENGYDCGLFVMAIAKLIVQWHVQRRELDELWIPLVVDEVNASTVGQMRKQILSHIEHLMEQQKGSGH